MAVVPQPWYSAQKLIFLGRLAVPGFPFLAQLTPQGESPYVQYTR